MINQRLVRLTRYRHSKKNNHNNVIMITIMIIITDIYWYIPPKSVFF